MKGPAERLKYDLRRVWECPVCHHLERTSGAVTSLLCDCQAKAPAPARQFMKLVTDWVRHGGFSQLAGDASNPEDDPAGTDDG